MNTSPTPTVMIQQCLDRLRAGDESARQELIQCACGRLERLTRKMLRSWQRVHRWEETGDVMQNALLRLYRSLAETKPARVVDFFRLAALHIRRELHDLAKHYYGPRGIGSQPCHRRMESHAGDESADSMGLGTVRGRRRPGEPGRLGRVPCPGRTVCPKKNATVFDLLWYQELSQAEAAELLGVSERTVKRRWASARLRLHKVLGERCPCGSRGDLRGRARLTPDLSPS